MSKHTPGDWYCKQCGYLSGSRVTNAETCDTCHQPVVWHEVGVTQEHIDRCVNALRGLDVGKVEALLDAVRHLGANMDGTLGAMVDAEDAAERATLDLARSVRDSIRAGGGPC